MLAVVIDAVAIVTIQRLSSRPATRCGGATQPRATMAARDDARACDARCEGVRAASSACDACGSAAAKYTCPACARKSCSLACVNRHKAAHECDGKRARVGFIDVRDFTDGDVVRDYRFLEDAGATGERAKRWKPTFGETSVDGGDGARENGGGRGGRGGRGRGRGNDAHHARRALDALGAKCAERGVEVRFMANGMARRRLNTTMHHRKRDELFWRCEWAFHVGDARVVRVDDKVSENVTLADVYAAHVKALTIETEDKATVAAFKPTDADENKTTNDGENNANASASTYVALLEQFDTPANAKRWHAVSLQQTLAQALRGKVVVEFPTFHVVPTLRADAFVLASP